VNEQLGSEKPDGVHAHIAGKTEDGIRVIEVWDSTDVIEVWDSTDAIERYLQAGLGDAMQQANLPEPTITDFEVHSFDWTGLGGSSETTSETLLESRLSESGMSRSGKISQGADVR